MEVLIKLTVIYFGNISFGLKYQNLAVGSHLVIGFEVLLVRPVNEAITREC